jgi:hypothetical protein
MGPQRGHPPETAANAQNVTTPTTSALARWLRPLFWGNRGVVRSDYHSSGTAPASQWSLDSGEGVLRRSVA